MTDENSGKWYDTKTGKVTTSQPEEGVQLVAEGAAVTPAGKAVVEQYERLADEGNDGPKQVDPAAEVNMLETATAPAAGVETKADTGGDPAKTVTANSTTTRSSGKGR